jgi:hypothetical protein
MHINYLCTYDLYSPVHNAFDAGSIHYEGMREGVGPWKTRVFGALWNGIEPTGECHLGPKKLRFPGPYSLPLTQLTDAAPHQKHYAWGSVNHRCIGGFVYKSPPWWGLPVHTSIICVHCAYQHTYVCITHMLVRDRPRRWRAHEGGFRAHTVGGGGAGA